MRAANVVAAAAASLGPGREHASSVVSNGSFGDDAGAAFVGLEYTGSESSSGAGSRRTSVDGGSERYGGHAQASSRRGSDAGNDGVDEEGGVGDRPQSGMEEVRVAV
jgi:hypothetical protein